MADSEAGAGRLTTHVLDTSRGKPASGLGISLYRIGGSDGRKRVARAVTNPDGRCDSPLLQNESFATGTYELVFEAGRYFDETGVEASKPRFLDEVVIRFGISEASHYHVPLLLSPFGYSTYRGS